MIWIKEIGEGRAKTFRLMVNDLQINDATVSAAIVGGATILSSIAADIVDESVRDQVCLHRFSDFPIEVSYITIRWRPEGVDLPTLVVLYREVPQRNFAMYLRVDYDPLSWKRPWSLRELAAELDTQISARSESGLSWPPDADQMLRLEFAFSRPDNGSVIWDAFTSKVLVLTQVLMDTVAALDARLRSEAVVMQFEFPPQVQGACEQYLTYFAQFLREVGIEATTDLQHEETTVLFSVTPKEKEQALEQVWRALALYLQLPNSPVFDVAASQSNDVRVQALSGMVQHYNSQLSYARATARADQLALRAMEREVEVLEEEREWHRVTIADQRALIQQQARALESANVLLDSVISVTKSGEVVDKEKFLGGVVALGTMEEKGISIDWAEAYRKVKRLISGKVGEGGRKPS